MVYLDANCIIYAIEGASPLRETVLAKIAPGGRATKLMTSRLSRLECRVKPMKDGNADLMKDYDLFFTSTDLRITEITAAVIETATELRAKYGLRTPDALHLATAIVESAEVFLTGDKQLTRCKEIRVDLV